MYLYLMQEIVVSFKGYLIILLFSRRTLCQNFLRFFLFFHLDYSQDVLKKVIADKTVAGTVEYK